MTSVRQGFSDAASPREAVLQLKRQIGQPHLALVLFFASPVYNREELAQAFIAEFPDVQVAGCTTAGEITPDGYHEGTLTGVSFSTEEFKVSSVLIPSISSFDLESGADIVHSALKGLGVAFPSVKSVPSQVFGMLMIDGMSRQEEVVVSSLSRFLEPIPLFGGSAGDGLNFGSTWIFSGGQFHPDAAVLIIFQTATPFKVFKFDHFKPTDRKMVVTEADPNSRLVTEINAERAAPAYAKMVGLDAKELSPMIFAAYPVVVKIGGEYHVRAIQKVEDDGSLRFYCGIDEGLVLTVASGDDMASHLDRALTSIRDQLGPVDMILGFDCILRRLEAEQKQQTREVSTILKRHRVVGFNTYGEQYHSMHVNQTFTGVAIGRSKSKQEGELPA
jgi:hypothetical protein